MLFNLDSSKQAQEIVLSRKRRATNHGSISFNNMIIKRKNALKHLGLLLDVRLNFVEHISAQIKNANKVYKCSKKTLSFSTASISINFLKIICSTPFVLRGCYL